MKAFVACSYIGKTAVYRMVISNHDRTPMCWHHHETTDEALACQEANAKFAELNTLTAQKLDGTLAP